MELFMRLSRCGKRKKKKEKRKKKLQKNKFLFPIYFLLVYRYNVPIKKTES